jgi:dipeptidyl aminopeptidase/acylaminoacyl peptidase
VAAEPISSGREGPLTVEDLLRLEELGEVALSPDGRWLAYVLKRPRLTAKFHKYDFLGGGDRADVFVVDTAGGEPQNLTQGAADGSGYWAPSWSPDSEWLAMLSTKGGNVHLWGCNIRSRSLSRLCSRPVDALSLSGSPSVWVSEDKLLVPTLPRGTRPLRMAAEVKAAEVAMREWPKAWEGLESTRSALESGAHPPFDERPQGELMLVDAVTGREEGVMPGFFRELRISPDKRHVAFLRQQDVGRPQTGEKIAWPSREREELLGVITADGEAATTVGAIEQPLSGSLHWSPDSAELAVIGTGKSAESPRRVFRYRVADGHVEPVTAASLDPTSIVWAGEQRILVLAKPSQNAGAEAVERADWWLIETEQVPRNISGALAAVPPHLVALPGGEVFVGLAAGDIFRLSATDGRCENLTGSLDEKISWLVWPTPQQSSEGRTFTQLVLAVDEGTSFAWRSLDLTSGELRALAWPCARGWLLHFAAEHDTAVPVAVDRTGARLWLSKPAFEEHRIVLETNTWLEEIAEGELTRVDYRGLDGDELKGWLILPVGYEQGRRYPLISSVYPGHVFRTEAPPIRSAGITSHHALNYQLLAARGYAVLLPSMPLKPEGEASDPYLELTKGVLPAVDKAIELGVADPDRLGVMGQSNGGYGTYGLITQTNRFNAAIALAGAADLTSLYGQFDPRDRYDDYPHEHLFRMSLTESGQIRMGGPPWEDAERYVRNSPLFHADRVETPLLIIQGDMDYVPLVQGEQFFTALYRQGKRARFARYWGEGHVFQGPANIRQMWQDIYGWFDEFLKPSTDEG